MTEDPGDEEPAGAREARVVVGEAGARGTVSLLGLWSVQSHSKRRHLDGARTPARVHETVTADVRRAARLADTGMAPWMGLTQPRRCGRHDASALT
ncbi:hypothetical protein RKE30_22165 [Streptomyces sp. Li-HN-5-11]|uniref:hypothetical protein n=1 Tax=Streptomyces sp. Li-HN-5-11 TaxID=3075432 RepID=UPI0028A7D3D3|nr:hypothetical protein [Streptomyces sp. Li-HN-5-11]WNM32894.1 hypothetical protein RKE30_22165 [Streptomyces sp. Li-HN-5-11]